MTTEYAVQTTDTVSADDLTYRRTDDGRGWSSRRGQPYTLAEAEAERDSLIAQAARRFPDQDVSHIARVVTREVTDWEPLDAPPQPVMLEALHVTPNTWGLFRAGVLRTFPGLDIVRLPDSEPGIRSWGITPKDLTIPQFNSDTPNTN